MTLPPLHVRLYIESPLWNCNTSCSNAHTRQRRIDTRPTDARITRRRIMILFFPFPSVSISPFHHHPLRYASRSFRPIPVYPSLLPFMCVPCCAKFLSVMFRVPFRRVLRLCLTCVRSATRAAHAFEILPVCRHACSMRFHVIVFQLSARVPVACTMWQQRRFQFRARATIESFDVTLSQGTETDASIVSARDDHSSAQFVLIILLLQPLWNVFKPTYFNLFESMLKHFDIWTYRDSSFRKSSQNASLATFDGCSYKQKLLSRSYCSHRECQTLATVHCWLLLATAHQVWEMFCTSMIQPHRFWFLLLSIHRILTHANDKSIDCVRSGTSSLQNLVHVFLSLWLVVDPFIMTYSYKKRRNVKKVTYCNARCRHTGWMTSVFWSIDDTIQEIMYRTHTLRRRVRSSNTRLFQRYFKYHCRSFRIWSLRLCQTKDVTRRDSINWNNISSTHRFPFDNSWIWKYRCSHNESPNIWESPGYHSERKSKDTRLIMTNSTTRYWSLSNTPMIDIMTITCVGSVEDEVSRCGQKTVDESVSLKCRILTHANDKSIDCTRSSAWSLKNCVACVSYRFQKKRFIRKTSETLKWYSRCVVTYAKISWSESYSIVIIILLQIVSNDLNLKWHMMNDTRRSVTI